MKQAIVCNHVSIWLEPIYIKLQIMFFIAHTQVMVLKRVRAALALVDEE